MSESNFWLYISTYTGATIARLVLQTINASRKARAGSRLFAMLLVGIAVAGVAINYAFLFNVVDLLPSVLNHAGFPLFTSIFLEVLLVMLAVKLGFMLSPREIMERERATSYSCDDGHVVRSRGEALIDNWFAKMNVAHDYEKIISLGGNQVKYDWYLTEFDVYVEYWGFHGKEYLERRKEKERLYALHEKRLLSIEDKDLEDIKVSLKQKLSGLVDPALISKPRRCFNCGVSLDERYA